MTLDDLNALVAKNKENRQPVSHRTELSKPRMLDPAGTKRKTTDRFGDGEAAAWIERMADLEEQHTRSYKAMKPLSCDATRRRINAFIESGEMKVGEFCDAIGVSGTSYRNFLGQHGPDKGAGSDTYAGVMDFFVRREAMGLKMPNKKQKRTSSDTPGSAGITASSAQAKIQEAAVSAADLASIHLPGEEVDSVEIYDSCEEIRRKIAAHMRTSSVTKAQFCRDLAAQYHAANRKIQSVQLDKFRGMKGPDIGNTNCVYYAGYVYFEKLRIKQGKAKSKHRQDMEDAWASQRGFDTKRIRSRGFLCLEGKNPHVHKLGRVEPSFADSEIS